MIKWWFLEELEKEVIVENDDSNVFEDDVDFFFDVFWNVEEIVEDYGD